MTILQQWMDKNGLKDHQVAAKVGLSRVQVSRVRRNLVGPSVKAAKRLATLTGFPWSKFMRQTGQLDRPPNAVNGIRQTVRSIHAENQTSESANELRQFAQHLLQIADAVELEFKRLDQLRLRLEAEKREGAAEKSAPTPKSLLTDPIRAAQSGEQMMTMKDVCVFFGGETQPLDPSTIYRWIRFGRFPKPLKIGRGNVSRWLRSDCQAVLASAESRR
jgi:predicted DNA-binding transcriptional regulator AlpA